MVYTSSTNMSGFALQVNASSPYGFIQTAVERPGQATSGTWTNADTGAKAGIVVQAASGAPPPAWQCSLGYGSDQGSYTMTFTVLGSQSVGQGTFYTVTGTLDATLTPVNNSGATGNVAYHATF
jgi:hypothetical protein